MGVVRQLLPSAHHGQGRTTGWRSAGGRGAPCLSVWETWCQQGLAGQTGGFKSEVHTVDPFQSSLNYCQVMRERMAWLSPGYPRETKLGTTHCYKQMPVSGRETGMWVTSRLQTGSSCTNAGHVSSRNRQEASSEVFYSPLPNTVFLSSIRLRVSSGYSREWFRSLDF